MSSRGSARWSVQVAGLVAAACWLLDQATKALAVRAFESCAAMPPGRTVGFCLTFNRGAAFSAPIPWWVFPVVTVVVVVLAARNVPRARNSAEAVAWGLLLAGALGNLTDRFARAGADGLGRGGVVDFIWSSFWPTFNVADVCITTGFALLVLTAMGEREHRDVPRGVQPEGTRRP